MDSVLRLWTGFAARQVGRGGSPNRPRAIEVDRPYLLHLWFRQAGGLRYFALHAIRTRGVLSRKAGFDETFK